MINGINLFNKSITESLIKNKNYLLQHPSYLVSFSKIIRNIKKQADIRRAYYEMENLIVPPILVISVINPDDRAENSADDKALLSTDDIRRITSEAVDMGVSIIIIAGCDPLIGKGILDIPDDYKETLFLMYASDILSNSEITEKFKNTRNMLPVININETGREPGLLSNECLSKKVELVNENDLMFGSIITVTSENHETVLKSGMLDTLESSGCAITFLLKYIPLVKGDPLALPDELKDELIKSEKELTEKHNMLIVALPGDEYMYEGCLCAGRGFLHIDSRGNLQACPFVKRSDSNLNELSFKQALSSKIIEAIRNNHDRLIEIDGGCCLHMDENWIENILD